MSKETLSTSEKEVPKHKNALEEKYKEEEPLNPENIEKQKSQLPVPSGWRLLVLPFTPREKTKGGRIKVNEGGYIGKAIRSEYGGVKLSNPSYEKYYKGMI